MRKLILFAIIVMALCSTAAFAAEVEYTVKKGDTLWGIAQTFTGNGANYKALAEANNISNPDRIHVGQRLIVSSSSENSFKKGTLQNPRIYADEGVGADPFKGTMKDGLMLLGLMTEEEQIHNAYQYSGRDGWSFIKTGDLINMVSGSIGNFKVWYYEVKFTDPNRVVDTKVYDVSIQQKNGAIRTLTVEKNEACNNWLFKVIEQRPQQEIEIPPEVAIGNFPEEVEYAPEALEIVEFPEAEKPCCPPEHEPILGGGTWGNGIAEGDFAYGEYMLWLKNPIFRCDSEYAFGLGFYGNWDQGESSISSYEWEGYAFGPQIGMKYSSVYLDDDDKKYRLQQWTAKLRLVWEDTKGSNKEGYKMQQDSLKLGLYTEYIRELNDKWMAMGVIEGWIDVDSSINSTWSGDSPSERGQISLAAYAQYKINEDWSVRFGGGPFYQEWDDMFGLHLRAEARWKKTVMFGPYANLFPFGKTDSYSGIPTSDLQTLGLFVRVEFGEMIRNNDRNRRMQKVKASDDERFGVL